MNRARKFFNDRTSQWKRFLFQRCPECHGKFCPVYGAFAQEEVPLSIYLMHAWNEGDR